MNVVLATVAVVLAQIDESSAPWAYVGAGAGIVLVGIALYAFLVLRKGRQLARQLKPEDRRWMS